MRVECHLFGACLPRRLRMTRASGAQPRSGHSAQLHFIFPPKYVFIAVVSDFTDAAPASCLIQKSPPRHVRGQPWPAARRRFQHSTSPRSPRSSFPKFSLGEPLEGVSTSHRPARSRLPYKATCFSKVFHSTICIPVSVVFMRLKPV